MKTFWIICIWFPCMAFGSAYERGLEAKTSGDFELAVKELANAVLMEPRNVDAWFQYGTVLGWQKRYDEAMVALDKGLELDPAHYDLKMARARVMAWRGDFAKASEEFEKLSKEYPESDDVLVMQGRVATWLENSKEAEVYYQKVLARNPQQVDALVGMGDIAMNGGDGNRAKPYFEQAYAIDPSPDIRQRLESVSNTVFSRVDMGMTASSFAGGSRSDWWSIWTQYSQQTIYGSFWGRVEQGERFDESDMLLEMGWENRVSETVNLRAFSGFSPDAFWAPNWYAETDVLWTPYLGYPGLMAEVRYADYVPRGVFTSRLGLMQEFGRGWSSSLRWVHQGFEGGEPTDGWIFNINKTYDSGYGWVLGMAKGAESLDGQALAATKILESTTYFGGLRGPLGDHWGWRADVEFEDYDSGSGRKGIALGVYCKF